MIVSSIQQTLKTFTDYLVFLSLGFSANYVTGGDTLDLTAITDQNGEPVESFFELPQSIGVFAENIGGYYCQIIPGAALNSYKLMVYAPGGAQLAAGAYPAALTGGAVTLLATRRAM